MTSAIVYSTIDQDFPVAGVDNDSQGFRDNFTAIKTGLQTANSEITVLQTGTAKLDENNDFNGTVISNAVTNKLYANAYQTSAISNTNVSLNNGEYQSIEMKGNYKLTFIDWPETDAYGKMRVELRSDGTARIVTFAAGSGYTIKKEIGVDLSLATGAVRNAQTGPAVTTKFSFPTANISSGTFAVSDKLYGTKLIGDIIITGVNSLATTATGTTAPLTIAYNDITTGTDTTVSMSSSVASINDGDPITLSDVTGVAAISTSQVYYSFKNGGNIKLSSSATIYTAIASVGTYTGGAQTATFRQSANSNRLDVGSSTGMFVNMPISFTGTGFGGVGASTDYYVHSIIDGTGIRLSSTIGGVPVTLSVATGTLTLVPRTVLTTTFDSQTVSALGSLTLTTNVPGVSDPFIVSAESSRAKVIEVWKQPYSDVLFLKYLGEFA
jgi:hypothetical protein